MASQDLERGGTKSRNNYPYRNYSNPYYVETLEHQWTSWLVPMFVVANIAIFIVAMYINNCPKNNFGIERDCVTKFLGRLSFQLLKENPLFGPSSSTFVDLNYEFYGLWNNFMDSLKGAREESLMNSGDSLQSSELCVRKVMRVITLSQLFVYCFLIQLLG
ncbi:hypothetical protein L484_006229 [Morus notabilis]|uniref:rhomboid protease n=1 Tax=Morus notabilis TaxID=981085 RepID=W9QVE3_9ROSA|nr:hypothetical protein L484_006229 [Morus notabilis]